MPRNGYSPEEKEHLEAYSDSVEEYIELVRQTFEEVLSALPKNLLSKIQTVLDRRTSVEGEIHERAKESGLGTSVFGRVYKCQTEDIKDIRSDLKMLIQLKETLKERGK